MQLAKLAIQAPVQRMQMYYGGGEPELMLQTDIGPVSYSLGAPHNPVRITRHVMHGGVSDPDAPVAEKTVGQLRYVLRRDRFEVSEANHTSMQVPVRGGRGLGSVGELVAIATEDGITILDVSSRRAPAVCGTFPVTDASDVQRAATASSRAVYAMRARGGGIVLDLSDPSCPTMLAEYKRAPWYADGARLHGLYARLDNARRHVTLYQIVKTAIGFEPPPPVSAIWARR